MATTEIKRAVDMFTAATINTGLGMVSIVYDRNAERSVDYLYFEAITTPAKGKKPATMFVATVSEFEKWSGPVAALPVETVAMLVGFNAPLIVSKAGNSGEVIKDAFALITSAVADYKATKPKTAGGPRKVEDYLVNLISAAFLVAAGTSGNIPETLDLSGILTKARTEAENKAKKLGKNTLGEFRLKAEKTTKEDTKAEVKANEELDIETSPEGSTED